MTAAVPPSGGSLVDVAMRGVRSHIRDHDLKVGDALPGEATFATRFGVSKAVMREAFGALAALRLIDVANGRRARVSAIDGTVLATSLDHAVATHQISVPEIWEVRRTLELRTAELAALNVELVGHGRGSRRSTKSALRQEERELGRGVTSLVRRAVLVQVTGRGEHVERLLVSLREARLYRTSFETEN